MRLPSIRAAADEARRTLVRFPLVLLAAGTSAVAGSLLVGSSGRHDGLTATFMASSLGLPLLFALAVSVERIGSRAAAVAVSVAGVGVLVLFALAWPDWSQAIQVRRYAQFSLGFHTLAAFLPFARGGEANGFWQYNRTLFLRFLTAALYSAVLYLGLVVALVAVDQLLKIKVPNEAYLRLWLLIAFVFNTWFFLGGVPVDLSALEQRRDYPRGLKVFSQFILIPLVIVYLAILTIYLGRILVTGQWPSGWIGYLVSSVAAVGMLSLLLVHPIRGQEENRWVATYARWFYVAMLPAIGMLLVAIWKRISQYGITEDRYFIAILSLWLAGIAVTFIARRDQDIRVIPVTLCILAFATAFGPQGAYAVSERSQIRHLRELLARHGMIAGREVRPATSPVPVEARREISSTLSYLLGTHGTDAVLPVLGKTAPVFEPDTSSAATHRYGRADQEARAVMKSLGMDFVARWESAQAPYFSFFAAGTPEPVAVANLDYHIRVTGTLPSPFQIDGTRWDLAVNGRTGRFELRSSGSETLVFPTDTLIAFAKAFAGQPNALPPRIEAETQHARAVLALRTYSGSVVADTVQFYSVDGDLYVGLKK